MPKEQEILRIQAGATDTPPPAASAEPPLGGRAVPASGRRQAFRDIRRQLTDADLGTSGVQRLILDELERAEERCETLQTYVDRFHDADKRAAILEASARGEKAIEILFGVGVGLGGTLIGLASSVWQEGHRGMTILAVGAVLVVGAVVARAVHR